MAARSEPSTEQLMSEARMFMHKAEKYARDQGRQLGQARPTTPTNGRENNTMTETNEERERHRARELREMVAEADALCARTAARAITSPGALPALTAEEAAIADQMGQSHEGLREFKKREATR